MKPSGNTPVFRFVLDPVFVASFILMLLNDHLLRPSGIVPAIAGKISDFAILVYLPPTGALLSVYARRVTSLLIASMTGRPVTGRFGLLRADAIFGIAASGIVFILIKSWREFNGAYVKFINGINVLSWVFPRLTSTSDITDLIALPSLIVSYLILKKYFIRPDLRR